MDDWKRPLSGFPRVRTVSDRVAPDTERLRTFADRISASRHPALVFGPEDDRAGGWDAAVALAEKLRTAVYGPRPSTWPDSTSQASSFGPPDDPNETA